MCPLPLDYGVVQLRNHKWAGPCWHCVSSRPCSNPIPPRRRRQRLKSRGRVYRACCPKAQARSALPKPASAVIASRRRRSLAYYERSNFQMAAGSRLRNTPFTTQSRVNPMPILGASIRREVMRSRFVHLISRELGRVVRVLPCEINGSSGFAGRFAEGITAAPAIPQPLA